MLQSAIVTSMAAALLLVKPAFAACENGHTFGYCEDRIVHWYDPDTGEICDPLDCGGGHAPVKYNEPGCAAYTGTEEYRTSVRFMPCFTSLHVPTAPAVIESTTAVVEVEPTEVTEEAEPTEPTETPEESEPVETSIPETSSVSPPTRETSSSVPTTQESVDSSSSSTGSSSTVAPSVSAPATTPAPTLSTVTESGSATSETPVTADPGSGAAVKQSSFLVAAVAVLGFFVMN